LDRYKARLVAKGYTQTYGIDYEETFAPVAKMNTVRIILSLPAHFDWGMHQFDVKNAFLHGNFEEEVYMENPPGYGNVNEENKVCRLKKTLYGLKQSPRAWFGRFTQDIVSEPFRAYPIECLLALSGHPLSGRYRTTHNMLSYARAVTLDVRGVCWRSHID